MEWIALLIAALFALLGVGCLILTAVGLPGNWLLLALAVGVEVLDGAYLEAPEPRTFGGWLLLASLALLGLGELLELLAGAVGTKVGGGTRRGMFGAIVGGLLGALILTPLLPIPLVGTLVGALIGTFLGALAAERSHPERRRPLPGAEVPPADAAPAGEPAIGGEVEAAPRELGLRDDLRAAVGATTGRLLGTLGKVVVGAAVWIALSVAAFWP